MDSNYASISLSGERPFLCSLCNKGFNVKSNLLRHLRTLHDQIISPSTVADGVKAETQEQEMTEEETQENG